MYSKLHSWGQTFAHIGSCIFFFSWPGAGLTNRVHIRDSRAAKIYPPKVMCLHRWTSYRSNLLHRTPVWPVPITHRSWALVSGWSWLLSLFCNGIKKKKKKNPETVPAIGPESDRSVSFHRGWSPYLNFTYYTLYTRVKPIVNYIWRNEGLEATIGGGSVFPCLSTNG